MLFERHHSTSQNFFKIIPTRQTKSFPLHVHKAYECYLVVDGEAEVTIDKSVYLLHPGEAVLVFPYQSHSYKTKENTSTIVCIFSPDIVRSYHNAKALPKNNKFRPQTIIPESCDGLLFQKACAYGILAEFDKEAEYEYVPHYQENLISKILVFISENYKKGITLYDLAADIGYDYNYVSKFFKKTTGVSFKGYVSDLRIGEACRLLLSTDKSVNSIADECGFSCTRTFNREFFAVMNTTPTEYRKKGK